MTEPLARNRVGVQNMLTHELHYRFYCWGPSKAPMEMTPIEQAKWHAHLQTPVLYNNHKPVEVDPKIIQLVDMTGIKSTKDAIQNHERVLILTPLRDASGFITKYFDLLCELTYPHNLIDLAFLVSDSADETEAILTKELERIQKGLGTEPFRSVKVIRKDFGFALSQNVEERHGFKAQGPRRIAMAKSRNFLLSAALQPEHSWVYWRDVDIVDSPAKIIEDFISHDRDILVPSKLLSSFLYLRWLILNRYLVPPIRQRPRYRR
jgi:hypothetical protein